MSLSFILTSSKPSVIFLSSYLCCVGVESPNLPLLKQCCIAIEATIINNIGEIIATFHDNIANIPDNYCKIPDKYHEYLQ